MAGGWGGLSGERLIALCVRTPAYAGVMQARAAAAQEDADQPDDDIASTLQMGEVS